MLYTNRSQVAPARRGFTLVEVLVVITIILVLVSLSVGGIMKVLSLQQRRNTESEISKIDGGFRNQWKATLDTARAETPNPIATTLAGYGSPNYDARRAQVIHVLMCLRREFPINFQEATQTITVNLPPNGPVTFAPNPAYTRVLTNPNLVSTSLNRGATDQSSACLYLALKQVRRGTDFNPDTALSTQEVYDPFGDGVKEIRDGWDRPVIFNRWPVNNGFGSLILNPTGNPQAFPSPPAQPPDSEDPEGTLTNSNWVNWLQTNNLVPTFNSAVGYPLGGAKMQFKLTPVIMSVGPNGKDDGNIGGGDDIYNFLLAPLAQ